MNKVDRQKMWNNQLHITHPTLKDGYLPEFVYTFWKKIFCKHGWHLFDEVISDWHYLSCDACGLSVVIDDNGFTDE